MRFLPIVGICVFLSHCAFGQQQQQQCDKAIDDFHNCLRDSFKSSKGQGQGQGGQNFQDLRAKAEKCFTDNNCDLPRGPQGGEGGPQSGRGGKGGRAGRVGQGGDNGQLSECFEKVGAKTKDYVLTCVRKADPTFNPSKGKGEHHEGFGGGFGGNDHHGGPRGGPGGPRGGGGGGAAANRGAQFLLKQCKDNQENANKVNSCLADAFPKRDQNANGDQLKQQFCASKTACKAKLGSACEELLEKRRQAQCNCANEAQSKRQEFVQQEPSCASVQQPQQGTGGGNARTGQRRQRDCSQKPRDPCQ